MADDVEEEFEWDADDFDPDAGFAVPKASDRWEGEDEDLEEKLKKEEPKVVPLPVDESKKKPKHERIEEKKAQRRLEESSKTTETKTLTPEEELAEKLRLQKVQKESDLEVAKQLFGVSSTSTIDSMRPQTSEEFDQFLELLKAKLHTLEGSPHYVSFIENFIRSSCVGLDPEDLRKISGILSHMGQEKQRALKATKGKKKGKATLGSVGKASKKADLSAFGDYGEDDDMGEDNDFDFM